MKITTVKLTGGAKQTGKVMHRLANEYKYDMSAYATMPLPEVFRIIADIPYRPDPKGHELVQRPLFTLRNGGDCDDKAIAMASWAILNGLKYRFMAVGQKKHGIRYIPLTHVYTELNINDRWESADCTYSWNQLGQQVFHYDRSEQI